MTAMNGSTADVLLERRVSFGRRRRGPCRSARNTREEARHPEHGIGDDVERDEQAIVSLQHRCPGGAAMASSITAIDLAGESLAAEAFRMRPDPMRVPGATPRRGAARRQATASVISSTSTPVSSWNDRVEHAAAARRHHRPSTRLRFHRHDPEVFFARQNSRNRRAVQVPDLFVRAPAEKRRVPLGDVLRAAGAPVRRPRSSAAPGRGAQRRSPDRLAYMAQAPRRRGTCPLSRGVAPGV